MLQDAGILAIIAPSPNQQHSGVFVIILAPPRLQQAGILVIVVASPNLSYWHLANRPRQQCVNMVATSHRQSDN